MCSCSARHGNCRGQILESFNAYGRHIRLTSALAIGGVPMGRQVRSIMQGVDVLVATPGRLLDLVQSNGLKLGQVEFLVLDEADRMLDMGFINDIRRSSPNCRSSARRCSSRRRCPRISPNSPNRCCATRPASP
ncbi:MAG: DEAD/DEAH box helicase [Bradyrhizobium sp.]